MGHSLVELKLETITKAIYAIVIGSMAAGYGIDAVNSLSNADWFSSFTSSLKTLVKSDEAIATAYPIVKTLI